MISFYFGGFCFPLSPPGRFAGPAPPSLRCPGACALFRISPLPPCPPLCRGGCGGQRAVVRCFLASLRTITARLPLPFSLACVLRCGLRSLRLYFVIASSASGKGQPCGASSLRCGLSPPGCPCPFPSPVFFAVAFALFVCTSSLLRRRRAKGSRAVVPRFAAENHRPAALALFLRRCSSLRP